MLAQQPPSQQLPSAVPYGQLNNAAPISDDYIGVLLRIEGVPDVVVINLLQSGNCNVDGLRRACANGQAKTALDLGLGNRTDLLDGFPAKVRNVFVKLGIISTPNQQQELKKAETSFSNTGSNPPRPEMVNPSGVGPLILDDEPGPSPWQSAACCLPTPIPINAPTDPNGAPAQANSPYIGGVNPMLAQNGNVPGVWCDSLYLRLFPSSPAVAAAVCVCVVHVVGMVPPGGANAAPTGAIPGIPGVPNGAGAPTNNGLFPPTPGGPNGAVPGGANGAVPPTPGLPLGAPGAAPGAFNDTGAGGPGGAGAMPRYTFPPPTRSLTQTFSELSTH